MFKYALLLLSFSCLGNELRFCYEDKPLLPFFTGSGTVVPKYLPGATIEMLQEADRHFSAFSIRFFRSPWKRCLEELKKGQMDGAVGSFALTRADFMVYPMQEGLPDPTRSIGHHASCFVTLAGRDSPLLNQSKKWVVAIPRAYSINDKVAELGLNIHQTDSAEQALFLLKQGRVDASVALCNLAGMINETYQRQGLKVHSPPITVKTGYFMVTKSYYQKNKPLVEQVWHYLGQLEHYRYYQQYLD